MAKLYTEKGILAGEDLSERVPIRQWIKNNMREEIPPHSIYSFLLDKGKYFSKRLSAYPQEVVTPYRVQHRYCHENNILYAVVLTENQPEILAHFKFVSGFYGVKAIDGSVPVDTCYSIHHHSFMTYKGAVLDCTVLQHPPLKGEVDQYFGVAFDLQTVVNAFDDFAKIHTDITVFSPLEFLNGPYSK